MSKQQKIVFIFSFFVIVFLVSVLSVCQLRNSFYSSQNQEVESLKEKENMNSKKELEIKNISNINSLPVSKKSPNSIVTQSQSGFKSINATVGKIAFSFDFPKNWLSETRNEKAGLERMNEETLRNFVATNYRNGRAEFVQDGEYSDYADLSPVHVKTMSVEELQERITNYPNITVADGDHIWYTDTSWKQIDFYVIDDKVAQEKLENEEVQPTKVVIGGKEANMVQYAVDKDDKGDLLPSKAGTGGRNYYFFFPEIKKALVIRKQALGDENFEKGFEHILNTLKISI